MRALALLLALLAAFPRPAPAADGGSIVVKGDTTFQKISVRPGDTLWSVAQRYLKDPARWDELLKHNKLPGDPTVALPGMTLLVPIGLVKKSLRAASVVSSGSEILYRRKGSTEWLKPEKLTEVFEGDSVKTLDSSKVRLRFPNAQQLDLESNSVVVVKPTDQEDVELVQGSVFSGQARVLTPSGRVTPRNDETRFVATLGPDNVTVVEVYKGVVAVESQGRMVDVPAGMSTRMPAAGAPEPAQPLEESLEALQAKARRFESALGARAKTARAAVPEEAAGRKKEVPLVAIGDTVSAYRVQASSTEDFSRVLFDKRYDRDERFAVANAGLPAGVYWWRSSTVDLLGAASPFSKPRRLPAP